MITLNSYEGECLEDVFHYESGSEVLAKPDGEPVDNLGDRDKADSEVKSTEAAKARDEVQPSHLL